MKAVKTNTKQAGIAVITAILALAIAVTAATTITANYQLDFRRTENTINSNQAWAYAKGAEQWTMAILAEDLDESNYDAYYEDEVWWNNGQKTVLPVPGGIIEGQIVDAQGKLNLNNLYQSGEVSTDMRKQVERLLFIFEMNPSLVDAIIDWIDPDIVFTAPNGAERDVYQTLEYPYFPADRYMEDVSELRLIHGFNQEMYEKLLPHVTALPVGNNSLLNINTASVQVLQSLHEDIDEVVAEQLLEGILKEPYKSANKFTLELNNNYGVNIRDRDLQISTSTNYFELITTANISKTKVKLISTIHRESVHNLRVVKRSQSF